MNMFVIAAKSEGKYTDTTHIFTQTVNKQKMH